MANENGKDIMEDLINDISAAREEEAEETAEAVAELVEEFQEAAPEADQFAEQPDTVVVTFEDELAAQRAVRVINRALRLRHDTIYQGAMIRRVNADELKVEDLRDMGLADIITGPAGIIVDLGRDGIRLAWALVSSGASIFASGLRLLRKTALQTINLAGATRTLPQRRGLAQFYSQDELQSRTTRLEPGETAVVIVADHETASEIATDLVRQGGELV